MISDSISRASTAGTSRGMPCPISLQGHLPGGAAGRGVAFEDGPHLGHHRLGREHVHPGPARDRAQGAEGREVEERGVADDLVGGAVDPGDRRLPLQVHDRRGVEMGGRHRSSTPRVPGRAGPVLRMLGPCWAV